jgi:arylsulfatase A-like enzyme
MRFLTSLAFGLVLCVPLAQAAKPNIVFIMADDLGWADVAFHGGNSPTPHLDKLAADGVELTQHYVAPVCSPTRASLMTGRYWSRFGITAPHAERALPAETLTLPRALKEAGYETCLSGKWHLGSKPEWGPNQYGFDHAYGSLGGGVGPYNHRYKEGPYTHTWHRNGKLIEESGHVTDLLTDEAIQWIEGRKDKPFFLYLPYTAVHLPVKEPQAWLDKVPASIKGDVARHYAASIMHLDDGIGRLLAALDKSGKRRNTLVIFTSDNGGSTSENNDTKYPGDDYPTGKIPASNAPLRGQKGDLFEGGIRVPTLVNWPAELKPGKIDTPAHIADWMPTLCVIAGWPIPQDKPLKWDGRNFLPVLTGRIQPGPRPLYWTAPGFRARALRLGDMKLIVSGQNPKQTSALFNLKDDPNETQDLAADQPDKVKELRSLMDMIARLDRDAVVPKEP